MFGGLGATGNFGKFGSRAAGTPVNTKDIENIQELGAWTSGWQVAVLAANAAPFLEDMNSVCLVFAHQLGYILQEGVAEYNVDTPYFIGSIVKKTSTGEFYRSKIDDNLGNALPSMADNTEWAWQNPSGPGSGFDADTVDGIHASVNPENDKLLALDANSQFPSSVISGFGNAIKSSLIVKSNAASPIIQVDIDAVLLSVQGVILSAINLTADITASGANGLDTGAEAASTWYAVHVITNNDGSSVASLFSLSDTAPTLPGGFTKFRRVGWVRNNASSNFLGFEKIGDISHFDDVVAQTFTFPSGATSFSTFCPPTSRVVIVVGTFVSGANPGSICYQTTGSVQACMEFAAAGISVGQAGRMSFGLEMRMSITQNITFTVSGSVTSWNLSVVGYQDIV